VEHAPATKHPQKHPRNEECPGLGGLGGVPTQAIGASFWLGFSEGATLVAAPSERINLE